MPNATPVVRRASGPRQPGQVYVECLTAPDGAPIEAFLLDPPIPLPVDVQLDPLGPTAVDWKGVWHIATYVGARSYSCPSDYLEEAKLFCVSRRLPHEFDFSLLRLESRLLLIHAKAGIVNWQEYPARKRPCPKGIHGVDEWCAGLWWEDADGGEPTNDPDVVIRKMPGFEYRARLRPADVQPDYRPMIFARFPISRLVVLRGEGAEELAANVRRTGVPLPVEVVDG